jgi:transposase
MVSVVTTAPADIPDSIEELRALVFLQQEEHAAEIAERNTEIAERNTEISECNEEISQLREYIRLLKSKRFGTSSERTVAEQMGLFNEAEVLCDQTSDTEEAIIEIPGHERRKRGGRKPLPAFLPREEIVHDVAEDQKMCGNDPSHALVAIGEDKLEQLVFIPATAKVIVHVRPKYACPKCKDGIKTAPMPPQPIPKSMATPSLLAQVAASKYVDGAPLYRQEAMFRRIGIDLSRATLAFWMIKMGDLIQPLLDQFLQNIRDHDYVLADETPFQVLKEDGKRATSQSYLWALRGGETNRPLLYYEYDPTRGGAVIERMLDGFQGFLQTDGYSGYEALGGRSGIVHVGCFAHARRKFVEALRGQGKKPKKKPGAKQSLARQGLSKINKLYEYERLWRDATREERYVLRQETTKPKLEELHDWFEASIGRVSPKSLTGGALKYLKGQWPKLERVIDDGRIALDTNAVERSIRPFVIGRRNWLFADTPKGAKASANLYSLVETAKANGIEPWRYLNVVFAKLPAAKTEADIDALLPWRIALTDPESDAARVSSS